MKPRFLCRPLTPSISVLLLLCNNPTTRTSTTEPLHFKLLETPSPFLCTFTVNFHRPTFCLTVTLQKVTTLRWIISQWSQISYTSIVFNRRGHGDFDFSHLKHDTSLPNYFHNSDHSHNMNSTKKFVTLFSILRLSRSSLSQSQSSVFRTLLQSLPAVDSLRLALNYVPNFPLLRTKLKLDILGSSGKQVLALWSLKLIDTIIWQLSRFCYWPGHGKSVPSLLTASLF